MRAKQWRFTSQIHVEAGLESQDYERAKKRLGNKDYEYEIEDRLLKAFEQKV